ncbi:hypothetical protein L211DRAFT_825514 [Terfezia boudieri ATCC MYA-4762]|uniref:UBX domain-containing protein n=1 Tax=Terfezia boudieri ATCC MYA-4762 TaxID=1051890 RepID=A0A3N4LJZ8_9PEZI|nr:hypothetical protein L211DRAFT_825514 [Terfezia boudieri ATCC MYA-4762]
MASSSSSLDADLSQLTPSQQEALQQFTAVTALLPSAALPILRRSQWNVQIAIAKFFDGETADPIAEALAAQASSTVARPTTTSSSSSSSSTSSSSSRRRRSSTSIHPAPRVVPPPATLFRRSVLLSILFLPFSLLYRILTTSFHLFTTLFPFLRPLTRHFTLSRTSPPRRRTTSPRDTSARFIREFEESTGVKDLPWFEGGYAQAMDLAKKDVRIMMVVLQSEEHDDTHVFNKETLGNSEVVTWIREKNVVLWGGSVGDSEGYQVAASLSTTAFPFLALISLTPPSATSASLSISLSASAANGGALPTTMSTILRISGLLPPQTLLQKLNTALSAHADSLDRIRAIRDTHLADRQLREQQNSAYEISLARDRERARIRREEEARRKAAEEEARRRKSYAERVRNQKQAWRVRQVRLGLLPAEPAPEVKAARVSIRFPDGEKVSRRFERETGMDGVYAWVECRGVEDEEVDVEQEDRLLQGYTHTYAFRLVNPFPRKVFMYGEEGGTVGEHLWPSGNLIVEEVEREEGSVEAE